MGYDKVGMRDGESSQALRGGCFAQNKAEAEVHQSHLHLIEVSTATAAASARPRPETMMQSASQSWH